MICRCLLIFTLQIFPRDDKFAYVIFFAWYIFCKFMNIPTISFMHRPCSIQYLGKCFNTDRPRLRCQVWGEGGMSHIDLGDEISSRRAAACWFFADDKGRGAGRGIAPPSISQKIIEI